MQGMRVLMPEYVCRVASNFEPSGFRHALSHLSHRAMRGVVHPMDGESN